MAVSQHSNTRPWCRDCLANRIYAPWYTLYSAWANRWARQHKKHHSKHLKRPIDPNKSNLRTAPKAIEDIWVMPRWSYCQLWKYFAFIRVISRCVLHIVQVERTLLEPCTRLWWNRYWALKAYCFKNGIPVNVTAQDLHLTGQYILTCHHRKPFNRRRSKRALTNITPKYLQVFLICLFWYWQPCSPLTI